MLRHYGSNRQSRSCYLSAALLLTVFAGFAHAQETGASASPASAPAIVARSGTTVVAYASEWDIDYDVVGYLEGFDVRWSKLNPPVTKGPDGEDSMLSVLSELSFPEPTEVRIVRVENMPYEAVDYSYLANLPIYRKLIPRRVLTPGTVVAVKTSEGAFAKLRVVGYREPKGLCLGEECEASVAPGQKPTPPDARYWSIELEWTLYTEAGEVKAPSDEIVRKRLSQAMREDDLAKVKEMLAARPDLLSEQPNSRVNPLEEACRWSSPEVVEYLVEAGADVNTSTETREALGVAIARGRCDVLKVLLAHGADVNATSSRNVTPLSLAVECGRPRVVECLLQNGADLPQTKEERKRFEESFRAAANEAIFIPEFEIWIDRNAHRVDFEATRQVLAKYGYTMKERKSPARALPRSRAGWR